MLLSRFGGDLLSHVLRRSTIGATALNGRVRDGTGCFARAMTTKPRKERGLLFWQQALNISVLFQVEYVFAFDRRQPCCFWIGSSLSSN